MIWQHEGKFLAEHYHHEATLVETTLLEPMSEESFLAYCYLQDQLLHRSWIHLLEWAADGDL